MFWWLKGGGNICTSMVGLQSMAKITHPPRALALCAQMATHFKTASQKGTRGMKIAGQRTADPFGEAVPDAGEGYWRLKAFLQ